MEEGKDKWEDVESEKAENITSLLKKNYSFDKKNKRRKGGGKTTKEEVKKELEEEESKMDESWKGSMTLC